MKKMSSYCLGLLGLLAFSLASPQKVFALAAEYLRNGECYMLIGEGASSLRGIYRLNDPANNRKNLDLKVITGTQIKDTLGFSVDLNRIIYTFTQINDSSWSYSSDPLYRQVIDDTVAANQADYGYHTWIHADYRNWGAGTDLYRTGPVGRKIKKNGSGYWSGFTSAGPGIETSKPSGYTLPVMTGAASLGEYSGKKWYQIPNQSWYSNWKTGGATSNGYTYFYYVFGDRVQEKKHNYYLYTWTPSNPGNDDPGYSGGHSDQKVAETKEEKITRKVLAGCLDGCGGASGSGSAEAASMLSDIAFQPPMKNNSSRTYFYSRTANTANWDMKLNNANYSPGSDNPLIGRPASLDTFWLCISLKNAASDYVYTLGTTVIKDWYEQVFGSAPSGMNISAVTVSNQWDQEGGIVYAYDKAYKKVYKFERDETSTTPVTSEGFLAIDVSDLMDSVDANGTSELDDIKADGFGSLYFAISHPSKNVDDGYDPRTKFKPNDCIHIHKTVHDDGKKEQAFALLYVQDYGKVVFERNYLSGNIEEIGRKNYATRVYNVSCKIKDEGWNQLKNLSLPNASLNNILASWSATVAGYTYSSAQSSWPVTYYQSGRGDCTHSSANGHRLTEYNNKNPGNCKLAVINVPTPPKVISLGNDKSYLDLIGPFANTIPTYNGDTRKTQQTGYEPYGTVLNPDQIYFYMVENYPIPDGSNVSQDPTEQIDYDGDARQGGFITTIQDRNPKDAEHPDGITYEWNTWLVKNYLGESCCDLARTNVGSYFDYVYSPVPGSFILTCKVKYNWYNYNELNFGDTIEDKYKVLKVNEYALPCTGLYNKSTGGGVTHLLPQTRLAQIKSTAAFSFMNGATDTEGNPIDYENLIIGTATDSQYLAIEAYTIGGDIPPSSDTVDIALIERCDHLSGDQSYLKDDSYWSKPPEDGFCIDASETYHWRIESDAQTNITRDISACNGTIVQGTVSGDYSNYNYVAETLLRNSNGNPDFQFRNRLGELRWYNNNVTVTAKLFYVGPDGATQTLSLVGNNPSVPQPIPLEKKDNINYYPVLASPTKNLPPTDPNYAEIQIEMKREYRYDMWAFKDGQPWFPVKNLPGFITIRGRAKVKIIDNKPPTIVWSKTDPNNLFGITGRDLKKDDGIAGKKNPQNVNIFVKDDNFWEAIESKQGVSLEEHRTNFATNQSLRTTISNLKNQGKATSNINLEPVFSRDAREVRLYFETAQRQNNENNLDTAQYGKVKVGLADVIYSNSVTDRNFSDDTSYYLFKYNQDGSRYEHNLQYATSTYDCKLASYYSETNYRLPISGIMLGTDGTSMKNRIPDGYANNSPGYRPYKFFVSLKDSSGNEMAMKELNLVMNVKDDIPPIGYGTMYDSKTSNTSYFPYSVDSDNNQLPASYSVRGEEYFALTLDEESLARNSVWTPTGDNGFVNGVETGRTYRAWVPTRGNSIVRNEEKTFFNATNMALNPKATEDSVECKFEVGVSDNCGSATAVMTISHLGFADGGINPVTGTITSDWRSGVEVGGTNVTATEIKNINSVYNMIFRGESNDFPMRCPIVIVATDNAREWDYYDSCNCDDTTDSWSWGEYIRGGSAPNTRTFSTSVPVFGSQLDIRVLDKTIKND